MHPAGLPEWTRRAVPVALLLGVVGLLVSLAGRTRQVRADFVFNNGSEPSSLDPHAVTGLPEGRVLQFLYEGLVVPHPRTLEPLPGVAESWDVSPDGRTYVFHLRPDARWSNGDPVTAADFEWSFRRLLDPETGSSYAYQLWLVRGARAFSTQVGDDGRTTVPWEQVGVRALDEATLRIDLESPAPYFLGLLAHHALLPVHRASAEAARARWPDDWQLRWLAADHMVSNGPFLLRERRLHDRLRLVRSPTYWDADRVALRTVDILSVEHTSTALNLYMAGDIDWVERVPTNVVPLLLEREDFVPAPYLGVYFYRFNVTRPPLDDPRVRRALALMIDRSGLCDNVLKAGQTPAYSFVPPGLAGYHPVEFERPRTVSGTVRLARQLLGEAGFPPATHILPELELHYNTGELHRDVAEVVAETWRQAIRVRTRFAVQEFKVFLDTQSSLDYDVSRSSWIGDFADPINFLEIFTSGNENNRTGWASESYDRLIEEARVEPDPARRASFLRAAELELMEALPIVPIFFYVSQNLIDPRVGGFHPNLQDVHPPKFLYWRDNQELRKHRRVNSRALAGKEQVKARGPAEGLYPPAGRDTWAELE